MDCVDYLPAFKSTVVGIFQLFEQLRWKILFNERHYKDANLRWEKQGLIENAWEESKEQAGAWFKDPNKAFFTDENGIKQSYIGEIKIRADELKN